jgi:hypothetical protein
MAREDLTRWGYSTAYDIAGLSKRLLFLPTSLRAQRITTSAEFVALIAIGTVLAIAWVLVRRCVVTELTIQCCCAVCANIINELATD